MKNKVMILLLIVAMCICGCGIGEHNKTTTINTGELKNIGYVIYEEKEIIDGIKEVHRGMFHNILLSYVMMIENIEESISVENVREFSGGYIIEFPMENRIFVIVANQFGRVEGSFMRSYELRTQRDINKIKTDMTEKEVRDIFPEIELRGSDGYWDSEIILENNEIIRIVFEKINEKIVVTDIESSTSCFSEDEIKEIMNIDKENLMPKRTLLVMDGKLIKGENQLEEFVEKAEQEEISITDEQEILKIKYVYTDGDSEGDRTRDYELEYTNGTYILKSLDNNARQTYNYLVKMKGENIITNNEEEGYFLVNDKNVTYKELIFKRLASSSIESLEHRQLFLIN